MLTHVAGAVSERKLRLVSAAAAWLAWDMVPPEMREAVETAERLADGLRARSKTAPAGGPRHSTPPATPGPGG